MAGDFHDVPRCISSPEVMSPNAPSHHSATLVASAQHQQNPPVSGQDRGAEQNDVVMSGADFLVRQMNEIRTANGDVIRMMRQLEGNHWDMVAMTSIEQVHQNLEGSAEKRSAERTCLRQA